MQIITVKIGQKQSKTILDAVTEHSMIAIDLIKDLDKVKNIKTDL